MEKKIDNTTEHKCDAVALIRSNFELWRKGQIKDGAFSWHLQNNLLRIEKELGLKTYTLDEVREIALEYRNASLYAHSHKFTRFKLQDELRNVDEKYGLEYKEGVDYFLPCSCTNELDYSNCSKNCIRIADEQLEILDKNKQCYKNNKPCKYDCSGLCKESY